jgi:hypothetical protein
VFEGIECGNVLLAGRRRLAVFDRGGLAESAGLKNEKQDGSEKGHAKERRIIPIAAVSGEWREDFHLRNPPKR